MCVCVCLKAQGRKGRCTRVNEKKNHSKNSFDFFLEIALFVVFGGGSIFLKRAFFTLLFYLFPLASPLLKKKRKIQMPHNYYHTRSFCRLHQKLSKTAKIIISDNERSNFVTHRPSRDPNRELVLGTVLFRCVGLLFFFENFCLSFFQF